MFRLWSDFVALDRNAKSGIAPFNPITVLELGHGHFFAVDEGAVGAPHVHEHTLGRIHLHHEVKPGKVVVLHGEAKMGPLRAADDEGVVSVEIESSALKRSCRDCQSDSHGTFAWRPWKLALFGGRR